MIFRNTGETFLFCGIPAFFPTTGETMELPGRVKKEIIYIIPEKCNILHLHKKTKSNVDDGFNFQWWFNDPYYFKMVFD